MNNHSEIARYTLLPNDQDAKKMLSYWSWLVPSDLSPVMITKFGDWFLNDNDAKVFYLDLLDGSIKEVNIEKVGFDSSEFLEKFKGELSIDWTEVCESNHLYLKAEQCYGWKVPPILGGQLSSSNIQVFSLPVYQSLSSQLHQQLSTSPENRKVTGFSIEQ